MLEISVASDNHCVYDVLCVTVATDTVVGLGKGSSCFQAVPFVIYIYIYFPSQQVNPLRAQYMHDSIAVAFSEEGGISDESTKALLR